MNKINHILFVDEIHVDDDSALLQAIQLAQSEQAKLTVVGCYKNLKKVSENQPSTQKLIDEMIAQKHQELYRRVKSLNQDLIFVIKIFTGKPFLDIIGEAIKNQVDIIIKPVEPSGFKTMLFGSQDLKLLRMCPCPVWLVKPHEQQAEKQILVAIDHEPGNPENDALNNQLLQMGISLALSQFAELHIVHTWELDNDSYYQRPHMVGKDENTEAMLTKEKEKHSKWLKTTVDENVHTHGKTTKNYLQPVLHLIKGIASFKIPELVEELKPELLIMGTVARTGIPGFLIGNTAEAVLFNINCSLLAVKPHGFVSPVKPT